MNAYYGLMYAVIVMVALKTAYSLIRYHERKTAALNQRMYKGDAK